MLSILPVPVTVRRFVALVTVAAVTLIGALAGTDSSSESRSSAGADIAAVSAGAPAPAGRAVAPGVDRNTAAIVPNGDPVIAAAGDIACDPAHASFNAGNGTANNCRQKYTSDLVVNQGLAAVLALGDNQYYCGGYEAFLRSYELSWGRVKSITRPVPGNHEYLTSGGTGCNSTNAGAKGHFTYFGPAAGDPSKGYYSFNIGSWHIIALNSACSGAGGCSSSTPQGQWLRNDLASHSNYCTLAFWHVPLFSSGGRDDPTYKTFWDALYQYGADVVLNAHDHIYERFAPQSPMGVLDPLQGIRQFIVGTGGSNHTSLVTTAVNSEVRNADTYGVLKLALRATSYDWEFVPEAGKTFRDSGSGTCHGAPTTPAPTGTVTINGGARYTASQGVTLGMQASAGVSSMRFRNDGGVWSAWEAYTTSRSWTLNSSNGTRKVEAQFRDRAGNVSEYASDTIILDTVAPAVNAPAQSAANNTPLGSHTVPVTLSWSASDSRSGIYSYQLQQSVNGGAWGYVALPGAATTSVVRSLYPRSTYQFRVRARDGAGNWSGWVPGPAFRVTTLDETSTAIAYTPGMWGRGYVQGAWGEYVRFASSEGAKAKLTFTGRNIALVSTKANNRGKVTIYLDGSSVATLDLYSSSVRLRHIVFSRSWSTSGTHTIEVRALGTKNSSSGGTRVDLDAFVALQ